MIYGIINSSDTKEGENINRQNKLVNKNKRSVKNSFVYTLNNSSRHIKETEENLL